MPTLHDPIRVGSFDLRNRVFMAPMTRLRTGLRGVPNALNAEYYRQRASAGLIITEGTTPVLGGRGYMGQPGIFSDEQVAGWKLVTDAVHAEGSRIALQIHHAGRLSHGSLTGGQAPVAPSAIAAQGEMHTADGSKALYPTPRALDIDEIPTVIDQFARATQRAMEAGFDFVQLHAANGYLPHEFLSTNANTRSDAYGGSIENRMRFTLEVMQAMIRVAGAGRVGIKLTIGPFPPHDILIADEQILYPQLAHRLSQMGTAFIEAQRPITNWGVPPVNFDPFALLRPSFHGVLIGGAVFSGDEAQTAVSQGKVDAVAFGRTFLANPDLPERLRRKAPLQEADVNTFYTPGEKGYTDYPALAASGH